MRKLQWCNGVLNFQGVGVGVGECEDEGVCVGDCQGVGVALIRVRRKEGGGRREEEGFVGQEGEGRVLSEDSGIKL